MRAMKRVKRKDLQGQELSAKTLDLLEAWLGIRIKDATHLVQYVESSEFQTLVETFVANTKALAEINIRGRQGVELIEKTLAETRADQKEANTLLTSIRALQKELEERLESSCAFPQGDSSPENSLH